MKKLLFWLLITLIATTAVVLGALSKQAQPAHLPAYSPLNTELLFTKEQWAIISTDSEQLVAQLCHANVGELYGCAIWVGKPILNEPAKHCVIVVLNNDPGKPEQDILNHELRHCREGQWHP